MTEETEEAQEVQETQENQSEETEETTSHNSLYTWGTGRRKTSVARVRVTSDGEGGILVNNQNYEEYFDNLQEHVAVEAPLRDTDRLGDYTIYVNCQGGGKTGQAEAITLGIARALVKEEPDLEDKLRSKGHLTRDPRMKERKKYGKRKARRGQQYSKR